MEPVLFWAFKGNARTEKFAHPVTVVGFDAETVLQIPAHILRPGFRSKAADLKRSKIRMHLLCHLGQMHRITRRAVKTTHFEVLDHLDLPFGIPDA